jgi:hypothetical protein
MEEKVGVWLGTGEGSEAEAEDLMKTAGVSVHACITRKLPRATVLSPPVRLSSSSVPRRRRWIH